MIWITLIFTVGVIVQMIRDHKKMKWPDWLVEIGFSGLTLVFSFLVTFDIWGKVDVLKPVRSIFEPLTKAIYNAL